MKGFYFYYYFVNYNDNDNEDKVRHAIHASNYFSIPSVFFLFII